MGQIIGYTGMGIIILLGACYFVKRAFIDYYSSVIN